MNLKLYVWRQAGRDDTGHFETYDARDISPDMSFLEMLDHVNEQLAVSEREPIAFEFDCREGICGTCSLVINGIPHGPEKATTTCQTYMRSFRDGDDIHIEPFRAQPFPVIKDLVVDRSAFDRILQAGGFVSVNTGNAPDGNAEAVAKSLAEDALDSAACIGCGACVAACPNASASLFTAAKVSHLAGLPQGRAERKHRARKMVAAMDEERFGSCTNHGECEAVCPMEISTRFISRMNREYLQSTLLPT